MSTVAVIPARAGSKRITDKNIRPFAGLPMIAHAIAHAREAGLFDRIIVSTDSERIADIADTHGAEVPFLRPAELGDDYTGTMAVIQHALEQIFPDRARTETETVCCLYPTTPLLEPQDLLRGHEVLRTSRLAYAFSVCRYPSPVQRALVQRGRGLQPLFPEYIETRTQDLEPVYHDAGQFYWGNVGAFRRNLPLFSAYSAPVVLPQERVVDIDTPEDWQRAEALYTLYHGKR